MKTHRLDMPFFSINTKAMNIPQEYADIRPFQPEELPAAFNQLLSDPEFLSILPHVFNGVPVETIKAQLHTCTDTLDFQKKFVYAIVKKILAEKSDGCDLNADSLPSKTANYTFVSNHRDIVLDAALLDVMLIDNGFPTTVEIAIGDNLLIRPWIETVVKLNKSFIVRRNPGIREMLQSSKLMSRYMHFAINEKHENIWIAQREGRAKDSDDRTQESLLKMLAMGGEGGLVESLKQLNIAPLAISYEYDPCDFLKAKEFQLKRDNENYKKTQADDMANMQTGILGYKGRVHYQTGKPVNEWIDEYATLPKGEIFKAIAARMDREIHANYRLFPGNYIAADMLDGKEDFKAHYTADDRQRFETYLAKKLSLIDVPNKDEAFLRERILTMYAMPLRNQITALNS